MAEGIFSRRCSVRSETLCSELIVRLRCLWLDCLVCRRRNREDHEEGITRNILGLSKTFFPCRITATAPLTPLCVLPSLPSPSCRCGAHKISTRQRPTECVGDQIIAAAELQVSERPIVLAEARKLGEDVVTFAASLALRHIPHQSVQFTRAARLALSGFREPSPPFHSHTLTDMVSRLRRRGADHLGYDVS